MQAMFRASIGRACAVTTPRVLLLLLLTAALAACKTEQKPDAPSVLGRPAPIAYLGAEYYYNFGGDGGEGILDYSLSNAPSWLALEDTSNKARQGIIMRGVPGVSGGNRGTADLGNYTNITLVANDGRRSGQQSFDIQVRENRLSLDSTPFIEGESFDPPANAGLDGVCESPDLDELGSHSFTVNTYNDDGEVIGSEDLTLPTNPVYVRVLLERPSVTEIKVAFQLESDYNPEACDQGDFNPPHQRCDFSNTNRERAILGRDIVALGSDSESTLPVPDYLVYQEDEEGFLTRGVITLAPGIAECYIRLEVINDNFAEPTKFFRIALTEVRSGLAALSSNQAPVRQGLRIEDNAPTVRFETLAGFSSDAINDQATETYRAVLSGAREQAYRVRLGRGNTSTAIFGMDQDYFIEVEDNGGWVPGDELVFPPDTDEVMFRVTAENRVVREGLLNDKLAVITVNERYQDGRPFYAARGDQGLRLHINDFTDPRVFPVDFVATDMVVGETGRIFVVGYQPDDRLVAFSVFERDGSPMAGMERVVIDDATLAEGMEPKAAFVLRSVNVGADQNITRRELAISWSTDAAFAGHANAGGSDVAVAKYRRDGAELSYTELWVKQSGTAGDDLVRAVALDGAGNVYVAGETTGAWPQRTHRGGMDSFLQRIDTENTAEGPAGLIAWTQQVGTGLDEQVRGLGLVSGGGMVLGNTRGQMGDDPQLGGVDMFFYNGTAADNVSNLRQVGTSGDDVVQQGAYIGERIWLLGNAQARYRRELTETQGAGQASALRRAAQDSQAGFLLNYRTPAVLEGALTLNDADDQFNQFFSRLTAFDGDLVVGGRTQGVFSPEGGLAGAHQAIYARVAASGDDDGLMELWRIQRDEADSDVRALSFYRDAKIVALVSVGPEANRSYRLDVLNGEGRLLNPPAP
ncbi:MAG: SBBP repeat-containing protein [Marinobacter sp.]|nr:SBBP repeat-containing protein [Marinobacter sp.]